MYVSLSLSLSLSLPPSLPPSLPLARADLARFERVDVDQELCRSLSLSPCTSLSVFPSRSLALTRVLSLAHTLTHIHTYTHTHTHTHLVRLERVDVDQELSLSPCTPLSRYPLSALSL